MAVYSAYLIFSFHCCHDLELHDLRPLLLLHEMAVQNNAVLEQHAAAAC
jgi:hypothetical protein